MGHVTVGQLGSTIHTVLAARLLRVTFTPQTPPVTGARGVKVESAIVGTFGAVAGRLGPCDLRVCFGHKGPHPRPPSYAWLQGVGGATHPDSSFLTGYG